MQLGQLYSAYYLKKALPFDFFKPGFQKPGRNRFIRKNLDESLKIY